MIKITPGAAICYNQFERTGCVKIHNKESNKNLTRGAYNGYLSKPQQKRVSTIITQLHLAQNKNTSGSALTHKMALKPMSFITLTLPSQQMHDDRECKRMLLDKFLIYLRRDGYLKHYVWKAERQKNGNIHFHICTPSFIDKDIINMFWNKVCKQAGYLQAFQSKHGNKLPPSAKIEASKDIVATGYYIAKYMAKADECEPIKGRVWGCSDNLRKLKDCTEICDNEISGILQAEVKTGNLRELVTDHCTIYRGDMNKLMGSKLTNLRLKYIMHIFSNYNLINEINENICLKESKVISLPPEYKPIQSELWQKTTLHQKQPSKRERQLSLISKYHRKN